MLEEQNARWLNHVGEKMLSSNPKCSPLLVYVGSLEKFPFGCLWPKGRISAHCRTGHRPGGGFWRWAHFRQEELHPLCGLCQVWEGGKAPRCVDYPLSFKTHATCVADSFLLFQPLSALGRS